MSGQESDKQLRHDCKQETEIRRCSNAKVFQQLQIMRGTGSRRVWNKLEPGGRQSPPRGPCRNPPVPQVHSDVPWTSTGGGRAVGSPRSEWKSHRVVQAGDFINCGVLKIYSILFVAHLMINRGILRGKGLLEDS